MKKRHRRFFLLAAGLSMTAHAARVIPVQNADFEAGADHLSAMSWSDSGSDAYYRAGEGLYSSGRAMSLQDGAFAQQDLGIAANSYPGEWTISFDAAFRDDYFTGSATVAVLLIDAIDRTVLASDTITLVGTGSANTEAIVFSPDSVVLDMSETSSANNVILKFENMTGATGQAWEHTALFDDVTVVATADPPVPTPPSINAQPQGATATEGGAHTFTVSVSGSLPMSYQWKKNGTELPGETAFSLMLSSLSLTDSGDYSVVAANAYGSITSAVATLTVLTEDIDNDGLPNDWETANGLDPTDDGSVDPANGAEGDPDADGLPNSEEYQLGYAPLTNEFTHAWQSRPGKAHLLVVHAHPDDEGIFFGGVLPYYTQIRKLNVVSICMVSSRVANNPKIRETELRNAQWKYGLRNHPIYPRFMDHAHLDGGYLSLENAWDTWDGDDSNGVVDLNANGLPDGRDAGARFIAKQIRRYRPEVVVAHDQAGEYGHGAHQATGICAADAYAIAADPNIDIDGLPVWQVKKLYIHKYAGNPLFHEDWQEVSIDTDGDGIPDQTPIQVGDAGLDFHITQGAPDVSSCYKGSENYGDHPCEWWGLYSSTVGTDTVAGDFQAPNAYNQTTTYSGWARGDFFENLTVFPDSDSDGMADAWELAHFTTLATADPLADGDGDGRNNIEEFTVGLDPQVKDGLDFAISPTLASVTFTLPATAGAGYEGLDRRYRLESSENLADWTLEQTGIADGARVVYPVSMAEEKKFYRLSITLE